MNRITNVLLLFVSIPILMISIFIGLDLPIEIMKTSGSLIPYQKAIFLTCFGVLFLIVFRRSLRRWMGLKMVNQLDKFTWNEPISKERKSRVVTYNLLEVFLLLGMTVGTYKLMPQGWYVAAGYGIGVVDGLIFTIAGLSTKMWRVGITKKAILMADRDVKVVYFYGLRKISFSQETLYFEYIKNLNLDLPLTPVMDKQGFFNAMDEQIDHDKVFFEESVKKLKMNR